MSQTINIKDIPNHRIGTDYTWLTLPCLLQFNFIFNKETVIEFHARSSPIPKSASNSHVATWKVKQLH